MRIAILILFLFVSLPNLVAQITLQSKEQVLGYMGLPQEKIFVHSNASFFLPGEYMYYKVYCIDTKEFDLTKLSKVAYVELLGKEGTSVFRQKVVLENGMGQGDFFIPVDVSSGAYKLVAYTNWMGNQDQKIFYQSDLFIVNPYRSNQPELQSNSEIQTDSLTKSIVDTLQKPVVKSEKPKNIGSVRMTTNRKSFGKREKVSLVLQANEESSHIAGNYSISVRKRSPVYEAFQQSSADLFSETTEQGKSSVAIGGTIVLPELRGELFHGKVLAAKDDTSVKNLKVAISIPGEDYVLEVVQTDALGNFQFNVAKSYSGEELFLQVVSQNPKAYKVEINQPNILNYTQLNFKKINVDFTIREEILRRSIHNQIENSYFQFRPDSVLAATPERFFDSKEKKTYVLDDYTRFKTLRETLVEIIQDVSPKRIGQDNYAIRVKGYDYASVADIAPLILLDGCYIQDYNTLLEFDTRAIEEIKVFRHKFIYGPEMYEGAILLNTKEGKGYESFQNTGFISKVTLLRPQSNKKYFVQRYDRLNDITSKLKLPDDRLQLLWMPKLKIDKGVHEIDFFTSDVSGEFEIHLEGITHENQPVSLRKYFLVE